MWTLAEEANKGGGNNKGMMMIIMAMLALIIIALVGVSIFLITSLGNDGDGGEYGIFIPEPPPTVLDQLMHDLSAPATVTTNLQPRANGNRQMVMLSHISIAINNIDEEEALAFRVELAQREAAVIDRITTTLRRMTPEELEIVGGQEMLTGILIEVLQQEFGSHLIVDVNFNMMVH